MSHSQPSSMFEQIKRKVLRDKGNLTMAQLTAKGAHYLSAMALAGWHLRSCTQVGPRARVHGRPYVDNQGTIVIGSDLILNSKYVPAHLATGHKGRIDIGDSVSINFGVGISAQDKVTVGSRVRIGPYSMIMDSDYHGVHDRDERTSSSVSIGNNVWIATRVTILRGAQIGDNSVITAGSVVSGNIPANVVAGGVPARVLRRIEPDSDRSVLFYEPPNNNVPPSYIPPVSVIDTTRSRCENGDEQLVQQVNTVIADVFDIAGPIDAAWGPDQIAKWTSMGHLQLALALHERFSIHVTEENLIHMTNVERVYQVVRSCRQA